jgi:serine/threonine-protein kinase
VLHRDLKGQNVILGDFGEAVVLDWGLARRVGGTEPAAAVPPPAGAARPETLPGSVLGTPGYMAPEQAAGRLDEIDVRTDVYGLGAILYEILTGQPPFSTAVRNAAGAETAADVLDLLCRIQTEAPRPPRALNPDAPSALQAICLKALARRREDRYQNAADLALDVQRWLADEPVSAYREPLAARLGRWGRRHRLAVTGLAVLLVCAVLGLTVSTILINAERARTEEARRRAERNYDTARAAVKKFFVQVSEERLLNEPGLQPLRQELLRTANDFFAELAAAEDDAALRADHGRALLALAEVSQNLGRTETALERVRQAEAIFTALHERQPDEAEHRHELGRCHLRRGNFLYLARGPVPEAVQEWEQARRELQAAGSGETVRRDLAFCANSLGSYYNRQALQAGPGRREALFEASAREYGAARLQWEALLRERPDSAEYLNHLAGLYQNLTILHHQARRPNEGHAAVLECVRLREGLLRRQPRNLEFQSNLGTAYVNLGLSLRALKQPAAAAEAYEKALTRLGPVAEQNAAVTRYQFELAGVYYSRSQLRQERLPRPGAPDYRAAWDRARADLEKSRDIYDELYRKYPREKKFEASAAAVLANLGDVWYLVDKQQARTWYDRAVPWLERLAADPAMPPYVQAAWPAPTGAGPTRWASAATTPRRSPTGTAIFRSAARRRAAPSVCSGRTAGSRWRPRASGATSPVRPPRSRSWPGRRSCPPRCGGGPGSCSATAPRRRGRPADRRRRCAGRLYRIAC